MSQASMTNFFKKAAAATSPLGKRASSALAAGSSKKAKGTDDELPPAATAAPAAPAAAAAASSSSSGATPVAEEPAKADAAAEPAAEPADTASALALEAGWAKHLAAEARKGYFTKLQKFLEAERQGSVPIYPPAEQQYAAFDLCPFDNVKVVILGQDPYHGPGQAHGLSFSVPPGVPVPPSLRNMLKEAASDVGAKNESGGGNLQAWAKQGVLLLNAVLTVRRSQPNSHKDQGWERFTDEVIRTVDREKEGVVFMLWGKPAQKKLPMINRKRHRVVTCSHPSPLSATKTKEPFIGSKCFSRANALLAKMGKDPVDWSL